MSTTEIDQAQARWPRLDVAREHAAAVRKYGATCTLAWLELHWLPRCQSAKPASQHERERAQASAIAYATKQPADWFDWFTATLPDVDLRAWSDSPIDLRQRYAREKMAQADAMSGVSSAQPPLQVPQKRSP